MSEPFVINVEDLVTDVFEIPDNESIPQQYMDSAHNLIMEFYIDDEEQDEIDTSTDTIPPPAEPNLYGFVTVKRKWQPVHCEKGRIKQTLETTLHDAGTNSTYIYHITTDLSLMKPQFPKLRPVAVKFQSQTEYNLMQESLIEDLKIKYNKTD